MCKVEVAWSKSNLFKHVAFVKWMLTLVKLYKQQATYARHPVRPVPATICTVLLKYQLLSSSNCAVNLVKTWVTFHLPSSFCLLYLSPADDALWLLSHSHSVFQASWVRRSVSTLSVVSFIFPSLDFMFDPLQNTLAHAHSSLVGKPELNRAIEWTRHRRKLILKRNGMGWCVFDWSGSEYRPAEGFCENGNEAPSSTIFW
jgi:hypothetical protein